MRKARVIVEQLERPRHASFRVSHTLFAVVRRGASCIRTRLPCVRGEHAYEEDALKCEAIALVEDRLVQSLAMVA